MLFLKINQNLAHLQNPVFAGEPINLNVFVKPDDQNHACMSFGMAGKRT